MAHIGSSSWTWPRLRPDQPMRARVAAYLAAEARAIERLVAPAPEQWWTLLFPIWDDIR